MNGCHGTAVTRAQAFPGCNAAGDPYCDAVHADYKSIEASCGAVTMVETAAGSAWFYASCPAGTFETALRPLSAAEMACKLPAPSAPYTQVITWQKMMSPVPGGCTLGRCPP